MCGFHTGGYRCGSPISVTRRVGQKVFILSAVNETRHARPLRHFGQTLHSGDFGRPIEESSRLRAIGDKHLLVTTAPVALVIRKSAMYGLLQNTEKLSE